MLFKKSIPHIGEFTKIPINLLFMVGFCVHRWTPSEKRRELQFIFLSIFVFHSFFDVSAMLAYLFFESMETSVEKTAYIIYTTFAANSFMKLACCLFNHKNLCQCLNNLEKYYPKNNQECIDYNLDENLKKIRKYNLTLSVCHFTVTVMLNLFPLVQTIVLYYQNNKEEFLYLLPFPMTYFFDKQSPFGYAVAYTTQCIGAYLVSFIFLGSDLLLITYIHMVSMNFRHLAKSINDYKPTGTRTDLEKLESFIEYHNHILDTVELIDETFNVSILVNYMGTAMMICLLGFQLIAGTDMLDLLKFLAFLISVLTHVYFISIFGTEMMTLSEEISEAFFHHAWYDGHVQYQRALTLPIARAQKPAHLNAYKFFIISMETFQSLLSISYQFFTLIKARYVED